MSQDQLFQQFLDEVMALQRVHATIIDRWHDDGSAAVLAGRGDYVNWPTPSRVLPLNNKATTARFGWSYTSLARMMTAPPAGLLENWTIWDERPLSPAAALNRVALVVEDASPDSVAGVLLLLMHLQGLGASALPAVWIEAIDQWERDGIVEDAATSWPAMASALAHRRFAAGPGVQDADIGEAWREMLRFLAYCVKRGASPYAIPALREEPTWHAAHAALHQEEQTYLGWLPHATQVQLSLPLKDSSGRRLLVDGLVFTEDQPTGTAKVFYRNDRRNASLGHGFTFAAHYRPLDAGTGNDFTLAIDPRSGAHLKDLWVELERRESAKWEASGMHRPDDFPRRFAALDNRWNEPWYLKEPEWDLIGAPRSIRLRDEHGQVHDAPGTLLTWDEVRDALWTVFNPLKDVRVVPMRSDGSTDGQPVRLLDLSLHAATASDHGRRLLLAKWPADSADRRTALSVRALSNLPLVDRVLAGLIGRAGHAPTLDELPATGTWERVQLSGGFAIVTRDGIFVLDDWQALPVRALGQICKTFHDTARLDRHLAVVQGDVDRILQAQSQPGGLRGVFAQDTVVKAAAHVSFELASLRSQEAGIPHDPDARAIREALDRLWNVDRRLTALEQQVKAISDALKALGDSRVVWVTRLVGTFGFAPYIASSLAEHFASLLLQWFGHPKPHEVPSAGLWWASFGFLLIVIACTLWCLFVRGSDVSGEPMSRALTKER